MQSAVPLIRPRRLRALAATGVAIVEALALSGPAAAAPAPTASVTVGPAPVAAPSQGIIIRDRGVCDPIRHMGC